MVYAFLSLLAVAVNAAGLVLQSPRLSIKSENGTVLRSEPLSLANKNPNPFTLGHKDNLQITFTVLDKDDGKAVQPHQTFLRFLDRTSGEEGIQPVRVTTSGKAKFEMVSIDGILIHNQETNTTTKNMARPPASLPPTSSSPLRISVILGSYTHSPSSYDLLDLQLPPSASSQHPDEETFQPLPAIHHTFRPDQKLPPKLISLVFAGAVFTPWLILLAMWANIPLSFPHLFSLQILPFTALLAAFEALLLRYWIGLRLGEVLTYGAGLALFTVAAGQRALSAVGEQRLRK